MTDWSAAIDGATGIAKMNGSAAKTASRWRSASA